MTDHALPTAEAVPDAMTERPQWVCWRSEERDGKDTKVPVESGTGQFASATDPATWRTFSVAREYASRKGLGLGFVFSDDDPLVGVDLDDCRDPTTGELSADAADIVARLDSFTEVSPSGSGVHVIVRGELPDGRNRRGDVELYDSARFFTVTGDHLSESPVAVRVRPDALAAIHDEYVAADASTEGTTSSTSGHADLPSTGATGPGNDLSDATLVERARSAANGDKFERLWSGSTAGYPSHSEADMALCSLLAFWTGGEADQVDRLFRDSGLLRPKWDEVHFSDGATYGERTIERAIASTDEFYSESGETDWELFENAESEVTSDTNEPPSSEDRNPSSPLTDEGALETFRTQLEKLERKNEQLQQDLAAERTRRKQLEKQLAERETGILARVRSWL